MENSARKVRPILDPDKITTSHISFTLNFTRRSNLVLREKLASASKIEIAVIATPRLNEDMLANS
ncbi:MAG: hypothetical protein WCG02_04310, partial [Candidatus Taylorbacteria bacterium]